MKPFLLLFFILVLFSYRWIFSQHFDVTYMQNLYDHSQWNITLSPRIMGDAELYQLSGYLLLHGDSPFHINPETPPLGKYFYGLSIVILGNAYYESLFIYAVAWGLFLWLSSLLLKKEKAVIFAVTLFMLSPLFFSQIGQIGLDLPQLCFLFLHIIFLWIAIQRKSAKGQLFLILCSGLSLGTFTATKIGVFTPIIFLGCAWYLFQKKKSMYIPVIILGSIAAYLFSYAPFFVQHHTLGEWIAAQKWIVHLYTSSHVKSVPFMIFLTLFAGVFASWWDTFSYAREWTLVWTFSIILFLKKIFSPQVWKKNQMSAEWKYLMLIIAGMLITNGFIPFWSRYLILVLPFLLLLVSEFIFSRKRWKMWYIAFIFISLIQAILFLFPRSDEVRELSTQTWQSGSYAELYNFTDEATHARFTRTAFVEMVQQADFELQLPVKEIYIEPRHSWPWQNSVETIASIGYTTPIGYYHFTVPITLHREKNLWKLAWQSKSILPGFSPGAHIFYEKGEHHSGTLKTQDGKILSYEGTRPFISLVPNKVSDFESLLNTLQKICGLNKEETRIQAFVLSPHDSVLPACFVLPSYSQAVFDSVAGTSGVLIGQRITRVYGPELLEVPNLNIVQNQEKAHPELFGHQGGKVFLRSATGQIQEIFHQNTLPGKDVTLPARFQDIFPNEKH